MNVIYGVINRKSIFLLLFVMYSTSSSSLGFDREIVLKSGFIYNFARLSEGGFLPVHSKKFYICSQDDDFLAVSSEVLEGKTVKGLEVTTRKVRSINAAEDCNILFVSKRHYPLWKDHLLQSPLENTMLIGEDKGFLLSGGHINFFLLSGKVRFEVSLPNLQRSGFHLSSKVLRLGRVHGEKDHE